MALAASAALSMFSACNDGEKSAWSEYADYRELNQQWLNELRAKKNPDGTPYYEVVVPAWNTGSYVLMHFFNDRAETEGNLSPLYTSTTDSRYTLHLYDGTRVDSSAYLTDPAPGVYRSTVSNNIQGWAIAQTYMRCGDTAEVIVPYGVGYGASGSSAIRPYSNLRFNIRLLDIYKYELAP